MTTATVTRNSTTGNLTVQLASSATSHASVPLSVTIPAGQDIGDIRCHKASTTDIADGEQFVTVTASATGYATSIASLGVTSVNLPDLAVTSITAASSLAAGSSTVIDWTVSNVGLYSAQGQWVDQVFLLPLDGQSGGGLVSSVTYAGPDVVAGGSYTASATVAVPAGVGSYDLRVITDEAAQVQELTYANNSADQNVSAVTPYTATVSNSCHCTGVDRDCNSVDRSLRSSRPAVRRPACPLKFESNSGRPQGRWTATTDSAGNFAVTFQPLANEAGAYTVAAAYPGSAAVAPQASFNIIGFSATPAYGTVRVIPGTPLTGSVTLTNLTSIALTGLAATAVGGPAGTTVQFNLPTTVAGFGQVTLTYTIMGVRYRWGIWAVDAAHLHRTRSGRGRSAKT